MRNPLLQEFSTPRSSVPFSEIKNSHYLPAIEKAIDKGKQEIDEILNSKTNPTFENTVVALEKITPSLNVVTSILFNLNHANTTPELQEIVQKVAPLITNFKNDLLHNPRLFDRVRKVYERKDSLNLNSEEERLLDNQYKVFKRNGVGLQEQKKKKLREIDLELAQLSLKFGENVLADTKTYELHIQDSSLLKGLPDEILYLSKQKAKSKEKNGWLLTLDYPIYIPVQKFCHNREIRKKMALAYGMIGFQKNENNNLEIISKIVKLRQERAHLLGYSSFASYILEERMAKTDSNVMEFLNNFKQKIIPHANKEWADLQAFAKTNLGLTQLQKWDVAFATENYKKYLFEFDQEKIKAYFSLENVLDGLFQLVSRLYGLKFTLTDQYQSYNEDVNVYEVHDQKNRFQALLYMDLFPREGKRNGAWMTNFVEQQDELRPHVSIVCNFPRSTDKSPSLLSLMDVRTLFHEFGHALHSILSETHFRSLSGTNVLWDFVELPSQIMENWCYEPQVLNLFAKHYQTGETIDADLIEKLKKSNQFHQSLQAIRQIGLGLLDMSYHLENATTIKDIKEHEIHVFNDLVYTPEIPNNCQSTSFAHIFQGGYAAGYYSYKWAEVLDADAFEYFSENGVLSQEVAKKFKDFILSKGNSEDPMILYRKFRGRDPDVNALLRRIGISAEH